MARRQKSGVHAGQRDEFRQKFFCARHAPQVKDGRRGCRAMTEYLNPGIEKNQV
jgi:hypothetical protein